MNWGTKIFLSLAIFIVGIVAAGIYMVSNDGDSLIDQDYYEKGIAYDEIYQRKSNLIRDDAAPKISIHQNTLLIEFKTANNRGKILLRKPSNDREDWSHEISTPSQVVRIALPSLSQGMWNAELTWESAGVLYQFDQSLFIN